MLTVDARALQCAIVHHTKKVKDICLHLDSSTKIKANSRNSTKLLENFKIALPFLCSAYVLYCVVITSQYQNMGHLHLLSWLMQGFIYNLVLGKLETGQLLSMLSSSSPRLAIA